MLQESEQRIWRMLFAYVDEVEGRLSALAIAAVQKEWKRPRGAMGASIKTGSGMLEFKVRSSRGSASPARRSE